MYQKISAFVTIFLIVALFHVVTADVYATPLISNDHSKQQTASLQTTTSIVINEVHYNPADNPQKIEFIELYNPTSGTVNLSGWTLTDAVEFTFATGTQIGAGQYLLVADDPASMQSVLGVSALGPWDGSLSGDGERIELRDASAALIDEVAYDIDFPWPVAAGGEGASMELLHPDLNNDLGSSWRSSPNNAPTPGQQNGAYMSSASAAPPNIRQVDHHPKQPAANAPTAISAKVTDPDGVASVQLQYQVVSPGNYVPAYLAKSTAALIADPLSPRAANPAYSNNWVTVSMLDNGTGGDAAANDDTYTASLSAQINRTLVRYRIIVTDLQGASVRVPYADDPSLNFAYFVYNGVPAYVASSQSAHGSAPYTHSAATMNSLPVYTLLTTQPDFDQAVAYDSADQIPRDVNDARSAFNWSGTFVYNGKVYDNIDYRLRQRNARYGPRDGKRSFRFRFNRGSYAQFHDLEGNPYPTKWRTLNTHKMWARGGATYGVNEMMNNRIWETFGIPAPATHWTHFRVVAGADEVPSSVNSQFEGDFYGLLLALENYDARFLAARDLEKGNLYKLKSNVHDGNDVQRYQAADSVTDASDFANLLWNLRPERDDAWLNRYVDFAHWSRYNAVVEAVRHYDTAPNTDEHLKNRVWYFVSSADTPLGAMRTLPWDADASWGPNYNNGVDFVKYSILGYDGAPPRETFLVDYRNTVRELRDLIWQEDQIHAQLDYAASVIGPFAAADLDRWSAIPNAPVSNNPSALSTKIQDMKNFAFIGGSWIGGNTSAGTPTSDAGISGQQGRDAYLDWLASDSEIPNTPSITYSGGATYPIDQLSFQSSAFADPQGNNTFASIEWRLAEITDPSAPAHDPTAAPLWEYNATWLSGELTNSSNGVTVPAGVATPGHAYRARVRMKDSSGRWSHWSAPLQFVAGAPVNVASLDNLVISEIHYNPIGSDETEFLEFRNDGSLPLYLGGVTIAGAVDFTFGAGALLQPGEHVLVIEDNGAFNSLYAEANSPWYVALLNVAGKWSGKLSNGGEEIVVSDPAGLELIRFAYSDGPGWLARADDLGSSLELAPDSTPPTSRSANNTFFANQRNWQPSRTLHGSPGSSNSPHQLGDVNCDEQLNVIDALFIMQHEVTLRTDSAACPVGDPTTNLNKWIGDVNADNVTNVIDALFIMQCEVAIANALCP